MSDSPLVRSKHPSLEQSNGPVNARQQVFSIGLSLLHHAVMKVPVHLPIRIQAVGTDRAARFDRRTNEAVQRCPLNVGNHDHSDAPDPLAVSFRRHRDQGLVEDKPACRASRFLFPQ